MKSIPALVNQRSVEELAQLFGPASSWEECGRICERISGIGAALIEAGRNRDAAALALRVGHLCGHDATVANTIADVIQWATCEKADPFYVQKILAFAEIGKFAFVEEMQKIEPQPGRRPFFLSAFMPKSGGTYIAKVMERNFAYRSDIYYVFGATTAATGNFLSEARTETLACCGGVFNHTHLSPNIWNFEIIRRSQLPFWLHVRDPRDAFFSLVNMVRREYERAESKEFLAQVKSEGIDDVNNMSDSEIGLRLYGMFESLCAWLEGWLRFEYERRLVTFHDELPANEPSFFSRVREIMGITTQVAGEVQRDYGTSRFDVGSNGRWKKGFDASLVARLNTRFEAFGLDNSLADLPRASNRAG